MIKRLALQPRDHSVSWEESGRQVTRRVSDHQLDHLLTDLGKQGITPDVRLVGVKLHVTHSER